MTPAELLRAKAAEEREWVVSMTASAVRNELSALNDRKHAAEALARAEQYEVAAMSLDGGKN